MAEGDEVTCEHYIRKCSLVVRTEVAVCSCSVEQQFTNLQGNTCN